MDIELVEFINVPNTNMELTQKDKAMLKCLVRKRIFELENLNYNADTKELRILLKKLEG